MKLKLISNTLGLSLIVAALCLAGCDSPKSPEHGKAEAPATHEEHEEQAEHMTPEVPESHEAAEHAEHAEGGHEEHEGH